MLLDKQNSISKSLDATDAFKAEIKSSGRNRMLSREEERALIQAYKENDDMEAASILVQKYLPMIQRIAHGLPERKNTRHDMVNDGVIGFYKALKGFDLDRGLRLSTYAPHWIKNEIIEERDKQSHHLRTTTTTIRKSFMRQLGRFENDFQRKYPGLNQGEIDGKIAEYFGVDVGFVGEMRGFRSGVSSLDKPVGGEDGASWIDWLETKDPDAEQALAHKDDLGKKKSMLIEAFDAVCDGDKQPDRARDILRCRRLLEKPETLEVLGEKHGISKERVRQIEVSLFGKLQERMLRMAENKGMGVPKNV